MCPNLTLRNTNVLARYLQNGLAEVTHGLCLLRLSSQLLLRPLCPPIWEGDVLAALQTQFLSLLAMQL